MNELFLNEVKRDELHKLLLSRASSFADFAAPRVTMLESLSGREKRNRALRPLIFELVRILGAAFFVRDLATGKNSRCEYRTCRIFTGKFYELFPIRWLQDFVSDWLVDYGRCDVDKYKNFTYVVGAFVYESLLDRMLSPRHTLMCFRNGVVDMEKMELMPHGSEHHVVKMYDFKWNPDAKCPMWKAFLGMPQYVGQKDVIGVLPEASKRAVLQKFLGGSFVDRKKIRFEYFLILYGDGANGKSVIKDVLEGIFGKDEILPNLDLGQLTRMGDEKLRAMDSMDGKRISYCTELNLGHLKQPETLKILSSGESTVGRGIGENIRVIEDIPLIICNTNRKLSDKDSLPKDSPTDESVSRRLLLISFDKVLRESERNPEIVSQLLKEKEGIFMWMVRGYKRLKRDKWKITESLEGRIDKIRMTLNSNVPVGRKRVSGSVYEYLKFKCCSPVPTDENPNELFILFSTLHENYLKFCKKNKVSEALTATREKFARDLGTLGYGKKNDVGDKNVTGIVMYCPYDDGRTLTLGVPSIIEELNVDALLREAEDEEVEYEEFDD